MDNEASAVVNKVMTKVIPSINTDNAMDKELGTILGAISEIATAIALIDSNVRGIRSEVGLLTAQVKYLSQLTEDVAMDEQNNPGPSGDDALNLAQEFLSKSPLAKHPMFKEMMQPLTDMINKTKG